MREFKLGSGRVHAERKQAARADPALRATKVRVTGPAVPVLEHLDADHHRIAGASGQRGEVPEDQAVASLGRSGGELSERGRRDVETDDIEPAGHQGPVVPAVAAADLEGGPPEEPPRAGLPEDRRHHRVRWVLRVPPGPVLRLPRRHDPGVHRHGPTRSATHLRSVTEKSYSS